MTLARRSSRQKESNGREELFHEEPLRGTAVCSVMPLPKTALFKEISTCRSERVNNKRRLPHPNAPEDTILRAISRSLLAANARRCESRCILSKFKNRPIPPKEATPSTARCNFRVYFLRVSCTTRNTRLYPNLHTPVAVRRKSSGLARPDLGSDYSRWNLPGRKTMF